jgi:hypothetical protein
MNLTKAEMKKQFIKTEKVMRNAFSELSKFQKMSLEWYGIDYSRYEYDDGIIIDGLDYGQGLDWEIFDEILTKLKKECYSLDKKNKM